jgi:hypothetical protein
MSQGGIRVSLKSAIFALKEIITNQKDIDHEPLIRELEDKHGIKNGELNVYYNMIMKLNRKSAEPANDDAKKINRKWTESEINFMFQYLHDRQNEGALNITEILEEIAQLLNRGYQSVNYKYYSLVKNSGKNQTIKQNEGYQFTTIPENKVPVVSTEIIHSSLSKSPVHHVPMQEDDLLDILSGLITNLQQLPGINLNDLLRSLLELTNLALQNQEAAKQINRIKSEMKKEKETLQEKLKKIELQLTQEKKRNRELAEDLFQLANEVEAFNQLSDAAKIQNLKSFNQRLKQFIGRTIEVQQISKLV